MIREPTATPRFAPALAILERAAVPSDAAADLRERAKSVYRIDPGDMRLARAAGGERIYVGENGARRICLIIEGTHGGVHCGGRGDLARAGMIALPFSRAAGDRRLVGVVVDGFDTAVAPGGRARIVDNVLVLPLGDRARSVTVSGPRGRFTYRLE